VLMGMVTVRVVAVPVDRRVTAPLTVVTVRGAGDVGHDAT
jgi:hypothetical protein